MHLCESQTGHIVSLMGLGKKRTRDEEENEKEAMAAEPDTDKEFISSTEKRTNNKKTKKDNKSPMINMFSNKVGWWSHIKGPLWQK